MNPNPMVAEVNRLTGDLLAGGERVLLPGIGSLKPITRPARRISKHTIQPPMRAVDFSSEERGLSLVDRIAVAAACSPEESEEVYRRWLGYTQQDGVLTIEGVGVLKQHHFYMDPAFESRLNPAGNAPVKVRRRRRGFDWMYLLGIVAILVAGAIAWYGYRLMQEQPTPQVEPIESTYTPKSDSVVVAAVETTSAVEAQSQQPTTAPVAPSTVGSTDAVLRMVSGSYYVVFGVFSSEENARRAVATAANGADPLTCKIYYFGSKWMVSPAMSTDAAEMDAFRRAHSAAYPDLWIYQAK
ncbi:MAG: hypothetical protein IKU77_02245 [Alistipes sp.]|nr:hypothetical protein [Alistipes sp.]